MRVEPIAKRSMRYSAIRMGVVWDLWLIMGVWGMLCEVWPRSVDFN